MEKEDKGSFSPLDLGRSLLPESRVGGRLRVCLSTRRTRTITSTTHTCPREAADGHQAHLSPGQVPKMSAPSPTSPKPDQLKAWMQRD